MKNVDLQRDPNQDLLSEMVTTLNVFISDPLMHYLHFFIFHEF